MDETTEQLDVAVPPLLAGLRLDRAVSMLTGISRNEAAQLISAGAISVNGRSDRPRSHVLLEGDRLVGTVRTQADRVLLPEPEVEVEVLYDDEHLLVVNKAPELIVHPGAGHFTGTMIAGLLARYPDLEGVGADRGGDPLRPGVVHRLDRGTSGLLVVARTDDAYESLVAQLSDRSVERRYVTLVRGAVPEERGVVDAPIGRSVRSPTMMAISRDGRPARTSYEVLGRFEEPEVETLLSVKLDTGRTHQIRVHLSAIGHPVVGDVRYGRKADERLGADRFFLHAYRLGFTHPGSGEWVSFDAPLPEDLARVVGPVELGDA